MELNETVYCVNNNNVTIIPNQVSRETAGEIADVGIGISNRHDLDLRKHDSSIVIIIH